MTPRTRFADDFVSDAYARGLRQLVLLGAGMDSRAFRLPLPLLRVFEVDQEVLFAPKAQRLADAQLTVEARRTVACDLAAPRLDLGGALAAAGFDAAQPAVWVLEGLMMYLSPAHAARLAAQVGAASAPGSVLFHDGVSEASQRQGLSCCGAAFLSGNDDYGAFWAGAGFAATVLDFDRLSVNRAERRLDVAPGPPLRRADVVGQKMAFFVTGEKLAAA